MRMPRWKGWHYMFKVGLALINEKVGEEFPKMILSFALGVR